MAKAPKPVPVADHVAMGDAAFAAMRHLSGSGGQTVTADPIEFAELQDQGPTARAERPYLGTRTGT